MAFFSYLSNDSYGKRNAYQRGTSLQSFLFPFFVVCVLFCWHSSLPFTPLIYSVIFIFCDMNAPILKRGGSKVVVVMDQNQKK